MDQYQDLSTIQVHRAEAPEEEMVNLNTKMWLHLSILSSQSPKILK